MPAIGGGCKQRCFVIILAHNTKYRTYRAAPEPPAEGAARKCPRPPAAAKNPATPVRSPAAEKTRLAEAANAERRAAPQDWGVNQQTLAAASAEAGDAVLSARDLKGQIYRARRCDVFRMLESRGALADPNDPEAAARLLNAVDRLIADVATMHLVDGANPDGPSGPRNDFEARPRRVLAAGARVRAAISRTGAQSGAQLLALVEPAVIHGRREDWRAVVEKVTGEGNRAVHAALVRAAMRDLRAAYGVVDGG